MSRCVECSRPREAHAADGQCPGLKTKYASMDLPAEMTCNECAHYAGFCSKFLGPQVQTNTTCDWYPIRFYPIPELWKNNAKGESPLIKAVSAGQIEAVKFLLKNQAELNTPDNKGDTPLHRAAVKGDKDMVKLLLVSGADASVKNKEGLKPADLAKTAEIKEMIEAKDPAIKR